jgi:hypothetical protein
MIDAESMIAGGDTSGHPTKVTWGDLCDVAFAKPSELIV